MIIGAFADEVIEELAYFTVDKKLDRRNVIVRADIIRTELIGMLFTGATIVKPNARIGIVKQNEINDAYYISKEAKVEFSSTRNKFYSVILNCKSNVSILSLYNILTNDFISDFIS